MFKLNSFLSFWYYDQASDYTCRKCQSASQAYLLRHRVFLGFKKPLIQIKTIYMLVCPYCGDDTVLDGEGKIAPYINRIKNGNPKKIICKDQNLKLKDHIKQHLNIKL